MRSPSPIDYLAKVQADAVKTFTEMDKTRQDIARAQIAKDVEAAVQRALDGSTFIARLEASILTIVRTEMAARTAPHSPHSPHSPLNFPLEHVWG